MRAKLVFAVGLAIIMAACDKKAEGQTVAIVNGEEITAAELNAELASANLPANIDKDQARNRILQAMIDRRLLAQHAREEGLDKSPEFLNRQRRMTEDLLISMLAARQINTAQLPSADEIARFQAGHPGMFARREQWNLEQIRFPMPTDEKVRERIAATKTLGELAQVLTQSGIAFSRGTNRLDTALIPQQLYGQLATLPPGEPFIIPVGNQAVASAVVSREPAVLQGEEARPQAVAAIRREQGAKFMQDRLKALREAAEIDYKSGFGPPEQQKNEEPRQGQQK